MQARAWIEAMRLRTLPVSTAGVVAGIGYSLMADAFKWLPAVLCLVFAVLAQVASNFANEYYDYRDGLDRPGREGPRRGVTEGDITPGAMKGATIATLAAACAIGLSLVHWGGWWLIAVGAFIAVGVIAYSAGPYPLSRHALGELAVVLFFGVIPVSFTFYVQAHYFDFSVLIGSLAIGLMGSNILIVNNYRDADDDASVGKVTVAVKYGRSFASTWYLINGYVAVALMIAPWLVVPRAWLAVPALYLAVHTALWLKIVSRRGAKLNPFLGMTAMLMLLYSVGFALSHAIN